MPGILPRTETRLSRRPVATALYLLGYFIFALWSLRAPACDSWVPVVLCATLGSIIGVLLIWAFVDNRTETLSPARLILLGVAADIALNFAAAKVSGADHALKSALLQGVANLGILAAAIGAGILVGRGLQRPSYLVIAAAVGAVTDVFSVYGGPSKHLLNSEMLFPYISFHWGLVGLGGVSEVVGAGDFIFLALYFYGARKFGLDEKKTLFAMIAAVTCGWIATYFATLCGAQGVPALPFFANALLFTHRRELHTLVRAESETGR